MRGCQRKIIMLKGTDSQIFDEAYFLLRKDFDGQPKCEAEILREAQRLVDANTTRRRPKRVSGATLLPFALGIFCGAVLFLIISLI